MLKAAEHAKSDKLEDPVGLAGQAPFTLHQLGRPSSAVAWNHRAEDGEDWRRLQAY